MRLTLVLALTVAAGCTDVDDLTFENPCDPANGATCPIGGTDGGAAGAGGSDAGDPGPGVGGSGAGDAGDGGLPGPGDSATSDAGGDGSGGSDAAAPLADAGAPAAGPETCDMQPVDDDGDGVADEGCNECPVGTVVPASAACIPAGRFWMGSPNTERPRGSDEIRHLVEISGPMLFDRTEVTAGDFDARLGWLPDGNPEPALPVVNVTWYEALAYANARSEEDGLETCYADPDGGPLTLADAREGKEPARFRPYGCAGWALPAEAQWERAARGGSPAATPDRDAEWYIEADCAPSLDTWAWYACNTDRLRLPAGLRANAFGLVDTLGNAEEWVADWYSPLYGQLGEFPEVVVNPSGHSSGDGRTVRGGAFDYPPVRVRNAERAGAPADERAPNRGFRLFRWLAPL
jgi:formylglycine-generating enzyme required for sulfatase activity